MIDILTLSPIDNARKQRMDFTLPTVEAPLSIFTRAGEDTGVSSLDDLRDRKTGVVAGNLAETLAEGHRRLDLVAFDAHSEMLAALVDGRIGAALFPTETFREEAEKQGLRDQIATIIPPFHVTRAAPALRFGLGEVRARLNAVIPGYLISGEYAALRQKYFGKPVFWTPMRVYGVIALGILAILSLLAYLFWQRWQDRRFILEVFNKTPLGVSIIDRNSRYVFFNDAHRDLHPEVKHLIAVGKDFREAQHVKRKFLDLGKKSEEDWMRVLNPNPAGSEATVDVRLKDGRILERTVFALDNGGQMAIRRDVTEQRNATETYARELEALVKQLELSNREQAEFTYSVSHDLKSPANTIGMLIEELNEVGALSEAGQGVLSDIASTNLRMRRLVDDVLIYSRIIEEGVAPEVIDLNAVIDDVRADLAADIAAAQAVVSCSALPQIMGHRTQLKILFQNLIGNAVKFRVPDRSPLIEITAQKTSDAVTVTIADNGIGIPEEFRSRVFGLFQRLHTQSVYEGTGLGLTICQRIMATHKGEISVESGLAGGTAFKLKFRRIWDDKPD